MRHLCEQLAAGIDRAIAEAEGPRESIGSSRPVDHDAVLACRDRLQKDRKRLPPQPGPEARALSATPPPAPDWQKTRAAHRRVLRAHTRS